ncbi:hypothetical protein RBU55_11740 [Pseudomonas chlororaphis subsp. aurantiaca]|uniref:hypothetical protein n=1 Tax=Pseudomonas chlororaphis TaxID=587753 RepID=UPI000C88C7BE|nr:hypothetical protein [Pseudomonas chlororaphis]PMY41227.1 hypothetical protein C1Y36_21900 [Pseudomonas sp. FW306-2-2C-D06C]PYC30684.1 hypothetical protein DMW99_28655 [Pseudomonas chlororaphis]WMJ02189.1 hypothetical protein RBU55_11740 [Pseudomonas chlororaphis subsp. aurantiaca]
MWKNWLQRITGKTLASARTTLPPDPVETSPTRDWQSLVTSWDGFDREAGLRLLRSSQSTERLAAIIVRLNDWVPQVREVARDAFEDYLTPRYAAALIAQLFAILALEHRRREDHGVTLNKLEALLATPECLAQSTAAFEASRGSCARLLFRVLARTKVEDELEAFLITSLHHVDFSVRRLALGKAMELPQASAQKAIAFGLSSNSSILRRLSFLEAIRSQTCHTQLIKDFLTDPSPATRSTALWAAKQHGVDPSQVLQVRLAGEIPSTKAQWLGVLGLAKHLGVRIPQGWLEAALVQNNSAVRSLVLDIEGGSRHALLIAAIADPSRSVFEAGVQGLRPQPWNIIESSFTHQIEALWITLSPSRRQTLLELMPKWTQAGFLLQQLHRSPAEPSSLELIRVWVNAQPYSITDRETSKNECDRIIEQLTVLETDRALPAGSIARLT